MFKKLLNTRDLGGIRADGGRTIHMGRLIRSGQLGTADEEELKDLAERVSLVVDFRTDKECSEVPDPHMDGIDYIHIPIIDDLAAGVSRDKRSDEEAFRMLVMDPSGAFKYMCDTYRHFTTSARALSGYSRFIKLLLENRDRAVLWHCTAGKDRAGFAAVIVLEILGADRDAILYNYLETNNRVEQDILNVTRMISERTGSSDPSIEQAVRCLFGAKEEYLDAAYSEITAVYGSFRGFLREGLCLKDEDISRMKEMYLD